MPLGNKERYPVDKRLRGSVTSRTIQRSMLFLLYRAMNAKILHCSRLTFHDKTIFTGIFRCVLNEFDNRFLSTFFLIHRQ